MDAEVSRLVEDFGELALVQFARQVRGAGPGAAGGAAAPGRGGLSARTAIVRAELALAALAATALLLAAIVMVDALRFHVPLLVSGEHPAIDRHTVALTLLALAQVVVTWRAVRSLRRQRRVARRLGALPVVERRRVGPHAIAIVADPRPVAFCAGLRRPACS